ncbi:hypothetical protein [Streptomyces sp. VNUA24]|uniref:hypothetical protein n=1 Tax=Streptomyces sp. VNUA24 TaxID=3031131 RepID=UPI0023B7C980|nr:hypothetical protein [Streptomyces sp. VNUA24]WEH12279.1 hypothetical protein PYR72_00585 [Streptomyces sp. VNUA24]
MPNPNRPLISSVAAGVVGAALALIGGPWWLTALAFTCFALGLVVPGIQSVFPQESEHRLAWWRARWNHQQRRQTTLPTDRPTVRPATGATGPRPEPRSNQE